MYQKCYAKRNKTQKVKKLNLLFEIEKLCATKNIDRVEKKAVVLGQAQFDLDVKFNL